jgi:hypothetical protein
MHVLIKLRQFFYLRDWNTPGKWAVIYTSTCEVSIEFGNCSDIVVFSVFFLYAILVYLLPEYLW